MPVRFLTAEQRQNYGGYAGPPTAEELTQFFYLNDADLALIAPRRGNHNRLGLALQLTTVRFLGTFLENPLAVPDTVLRCLARQLNIADLNGLEAYRTGEQRWDHAAEIRTRYGYRDVLVKGFVDEVVIFCDGAEIARHERSYGHGDFVFEPRHYLALLEQKPGALDQAAPLQGWIMPEALSHLRRLLEARMGKRGKREFIQVLRLTEVFAETVVVAASLEAIRLGAIGFDAVKQLAIARIENRPARLDLSAYPYLPATTVATTQPADYLALLSREAA